jgi:Uma2 family endonuclease
MTSNPAQYIERYSASDHRQWQGDWELIHGFPHAMTPSPTFMHQRVALRIARLLDEMLEQCPACHAVFETDVEFSEDTVVRPDCMVICYEPEDERLTRAPELIFEVVSKTSARRDELLKFDLYQHEGVAHFVLVYPDQRKAKVYQLMDGAYRKVGDFSREVRLFDLSKCAIDFDFGFIWQ